MTTELAVPVAGYDTCHNPGVGAGQETKELDSRSGVSYPVDSGKSAGLGLLDHQAAASRRKGIDQSAEFGEVDLHWLWRETVNRLDVLAKRVSEGKCLDAALEFATWLLSSGLLDLFERNARAEPLKVDGAFARWKCEELQGAVRERFIKNDSAPHMPELGRLEGIEQKLDLIAGCLVKVVEHQKMVLPRPVVVLGNTETQSRNLLLQTSSDSTTPLNVSRAM